MESPLKERLTGALIVVAVLVIVVPEMLSGPEKSSSASKQGAGAGPPVRTYSLELGSNAAPRSENQSALTPQSSEPAAAQPAPVSSPAPAAAPPGETASPPASSPAAASVAEPVPAPKPAPAPPVAAGKPAADVKPAAPAPAAASEPAASAKGQWWTQLGSFSSRDNAERLARDLRGKGYSVNVARLKVGNKELYRVRSGPVANREAAVALQSRLAAAGHKSSLVPP